MVDKDFPFEEFQKNGELHTEKFNKDVIKEYLGVIRVNLIPIILIFLVSIVITFIYVYNSIDIYRATTVIQVEPPQGNILKSSFSELEGAQDDRYIANQIEVLNSYKIRNKVAEALIDSVKIHDKASKFHHLIIKTELPDIVPVPIEILRKSLLGIVSINQKKGLDAVNISAEGPYFSEVQLITHTYANVYLDYNLELSREDVKNVKNYLNSEKENKLNELNIAEVSLEDFQKRTGIVRLDEQAGQLVNTISDYDAAKNLAQIDLIANERKLNTLRAEFEKIDPELYDYVEAKLSEPYLKELQGEIAKIEVERDIEMANISDPRVKAKISRDAERKLKSLNDELDKQVSIFKSGVEAETPDEKKRLWTELLNTTIQSRVLNSKLNSFGNVLRGYEAEFSKLPSQSIELAKLERTRNSTEKLYLILEEKYQEATINERSRLGNVSILDPGADNYGPVKPNRPRIMLFGAAMGMILGLLFAFARNYFDRTIKTPDDLENKGASVLAWIPSIDDLADKGDLESEFVVALRPSSAVSESFKALRTRVQFAKLESDRLQTILVTSSIPAEGKTLVSVNLAGSFAQAGKKVLILDCDLRKPKVHSIFKAERYPGLSDYLFGNVEFDDIVRPTQLENLSFITSGTIPPNPSELLGSVQMKDFLDMLKKKYDIIIIDSPPYITVTDSEILFNITDGAILIAQSNKTPIETFWKIYQSIYQKNPHNFLGCILNNFSFKSTYGYYYNYYYYYSRPEENAPKQQAEKK